MSGIQLGAITVASITAAQVGWIEDPVDEYRVIDQREAPGSGRGYKNDLRPAVRESTVLRNPAQPSTLQ